MRTVTCTCIDCGKDFQSILTVGNVCDDCSDVAVVYINKDDNEEWFVNLPKRDSEDKRVELIAEGHRRVYIAAAICTAF